MYKTKGFLSAFDFLSDKPQSKSKAPPQENIKNDIQINEEKPKEIKKKEKINEPEPIVIENQDVGMPVNYQEYFQNFPNEPHEENFNAQKPKGDSIPAPQIQQQPKK